MLAIANKYGIQECNAKSSGEYVKEFIKWFCF